MAGLFKDIFGGKKAEPAAASPDDGFADFAGAPDPSPASIVASSATTSFAAESFPTSAYAARPYTAWYRVWERTQLSDFYAELFILPLILVVIAIHVWGVRANRRKAHGWFKAHGPALQAEYALVGFGGRRAPSLGEVESVGLLQADGSDQLIIPEEAMREQAANEYVTYATGRQNVAFADVRVVLAKRYNPMMLLGETALGFVFDSMVPEKERMEITVYAFDGRENGLVPQQIRESEGKKGVGKSEYDGFVWAIVNKDMMRRLRDDRYDLSLTATKDHPKLPPWCTVMSESAEVTDMMLTPELIKAVEQVGDSLDALIISDQPVDKPKKLDDTVPKKRLSLIIRLPSGGNPDYAFSLPIFTAFLRLPDFLVSHAHFRPEVMKRIKAARQEEIDRIRRVDDEERAEERKSKLDKKKKEDREQMLKGLSSEEQRKFLEKERQKEQRRGMSKKTMRA